MWTMSYLLTLSKQKFQLKEEEEALMALLEQCHTDSYQLWKKKTFKKNDI